MSSMLRRRRFLDRLVAGAASLAAVPRLAAAERENPRVMTVLGPIRPEEMGVTLTHEHVLVDFIGADKISRDRYDADDAFAKIVPHLRRVRDLGCRTLVECTPAYIGRDPALLKRLSQASGLHILTNTGYYGAADNKFLAKHAFTESVDQLAERWLKECREGIEDTGIRPGFIKIGVGGQSLSELHRKLVRAAARTHRASGLTIASHTGRAALALEQLAVLREEGVSGSAFIWVHAQAEPDPALCLQVVESGAWVSFDGYAPDETARYVGVAKRLREQGRLQQLLLSHDAGWYRPGEPKEGEFRPFDAIFKELVPALRGAGFSAGEVDEVLARNPQAAFAIRFRKG
jgi:predicted metal-dependent phosphotriesterase family hydrolase